MIADFILLITNYIFFVFLINFFNFKGILKKNLNIYKKIFKTFKMKASDSWKEKFLLKSSLSLLGISLKIFLVLSIMILIVFIFNYLNKDYFEFLMSLTGIILICLFAISHYFLIKYGLL